MVFGSNLVGTFHSFSSDVLDNCHHKNFRTPQPLPFKSFPIHDSPVILAQALYSLGYW